MALVEAGLHRAKQERRHFPLRPGEERSAGLAYPGAIALHRTHRREPKPDKLSAVPRIKEVAPLECLRVDVFAEAAADTIPVAVEHEFQEFACVPEKAFPHGVKAAAQRDQPRNGKEQHAHALAEPLRGKP